MLEKATEQLEWLKVAIEEDKKQMSKFSSFPFLLISTPYSEFLSLPSIRGGHAD